MLTRMPRWQHNNIEYSLINWAFHRKWERVLIAVGLALVMDLKIRFRSRERCRWNAPAAESHLKPAWDLYTYSAHFSVWRILVALRWAWLWADQWIVVARAVSSRGSSCVRQKVQIATATSLARVCCAAAYRSLGLLLDTVFTYKLSLWFKWMLLSTFAWCAILAVSLLSFSKPFVFWSSLSSLFVSLSLLPDCFTRNLLVVFLINAISQNWFAIKYCLKAS